MLLRELIDIPEAVNRGDFVLNLAEGVQRPEETLRHYVVTSQLKRSFEDALRFIHSALESRSSKAAYLHGSFGSGKSHFMAVLHLLLQHNPCARSHPELADLALHNTWIEGKKFLLVPYHMIGAVSMESAILGGYERHVRKLHPEAPLPAVFQTERLFADAQGLLERMGADTFFDGLNSTSAAEDLDWGALTAARWDAASFAEALQAPPGAESRRQLVQDLIHAYFRSYADVARDQSEAFVSLDEGLAILSQHAASLKYDGLILFLDELVLWLASRAADLKFLHQEGQKLVKLVEAQHADRPIPIVSFVARQRDLRELVGEQLTGVEHFNFSEALKHWEGRFHPINLEDRNLPEIAAKRLLRPRNEEAKKQLDTAFEGLRLRDDAREVLLTSRYDLETFRKVYPFSPALVETLVAVSAVLQRERTALRIMMELLVNQRDRLQVGQIIPVGDLYDYVSRGEEAYSRSLKDAFEAARRLYKSKFIPLISDRHGLDPNSEPVEGDKSWEAYENDLRLVKTLLLSALVPEVESLRNLTPARLAALNHGSIRSPIPGREAQAVLSKLSEWNAQIGELRIGDEGANPTVQLQLTSVDVERILEQVPHLDNPGNRKRKVRELLFHALGLKEPDAAEFSQTYPIFWRGSTRRYEVAYLNVRETRPEGLMPSADNPRVVIDFPFDEEGWGPNDDLRHVKTFCEGHAPCRTLVWLPSFLSTTAQKDLGLLCMLDYILTEAQFEEVTRHLSLIDRSVARNLLENRRNAVRARMRNYLEAVYGIRNADPGVLDPRGTLTAEEQFNSLDPSFRPRPPVGANLADALKALLFQELAFRYPGHPDFPLDSEIRAAHLRPVLVELQRAAQSPDGRLHVEDRACREKLRQIAEPLRLGNLHDNIFLLKDDWRRHFEKKLFELGEATRPTVRMLHAWIDEPTPTGLSDLLRNLVVLTFAAQTNRVCSRQGLLLPSPECDQLTPDTELVEQALPSEAEWEKACSKMRALFGVETPAMRNAENVVALAESVKKKVAPWREAAEHLPAQLVTLCELFKLSPEDSPRVQLQRQAREFVLNMRGEPLEVVRKLAQIELPEPPAALTRALETAGPLQQTLERFNEGILAELAPLAAEHTQAENLVAPLRAALLLPEHAQPLKKQLERVNAEGARVLREILQPIPPPPPPPPPPLPPLPDPAPKPTRTSVNEKRFVSLSPATALEKLEQLKAFLHDPQNEVDLQWTVWRRNP